MYGFYGLKHHTVEMLPCGTYGRRQTREDKATQPLDAGRLSFAKRGEMLRKLWRKSGKGRQGVWEGGSW